MADGYNSRKWRAYFRPLLPLPCSRGCGHLVYPEQRWHVDHLVEVARGGTSTVDNLWPAHGACNERAGQKIGAARRRTNKNNEKRENFLEL